MLNGYMATERRIRRIRRRAARRRERLARLHGSRVDWSDLMRRAA